MEKYQKIIKFIDQLIAKNHHFPKSDKISIFQKHGKQQKMTAKYTSKKRGVSTRHRS